MQLDFQATILLIWKQWKAEIKCILFIFIDIVTLDYKTLLLLLVKKDDEEFVLGGRGVDVEFCFLCDAIRVIV